VTYDRTEFDAAREAGLIKQHARRLAHQLARRIRASQYTHGDGDLTVHDDDVVLLAAEILNLGDITDTPRSDS
jgi:hypothetical protein